MQHTIPEGEVLAERHLPEGTHLVARINEDLAGALTPVVRQQAG